MPPPTSPNPMMQALQQSRASNPTPSGPVVAQPGQPQPGGPPPEIQKMASDIQDIGAKLDKLIAAISGKYTGKAEGSEPVEEEGETGESQTFTEKK